LITLTIARTALDQALSQDGT